MTLTEETMTIVESTAPILKERGVEITTHFYNELFAAHPGVMDMFTTPTGLQAERLAGAVLAYATNIRHLDVLGPAVERMVAAHVAADVQPEHYDLVGAQLLKSIDEVLGGVDSSVIDAWGEAYGALAEILISAEADARAVA